MLPRRLTTRIRSTGVLDSLWTLTSSFGSKIQTLTVLAIAARTGDVESAAHVVLGTSSSALCLTIVDAGLSTQVVRQYAQHRSLATRALIRPLLLRVPIYVPLVLVLSAALYRSTGTDWLLFFLAVLILATGLQASQAVSQATYGLGLFRRGAAVNGVVRAGTVPVLICLGLAGVPAELLLIIVGLGEYVIALLQYRHIARRSTERLLNSRNAFHVRSSWRYGVGGIANTLMNRSDTVVVSFFSGAAVVAVYGVASQVENALTTLALVPAAALVTYTARATAEGRNSRHLPTVAWSVVIAYTVIAIPFTVFPQQLVGAVFSSQVADPAVIRICVLAGLFSSLAGVAMQQLVGLGRAVVVSTLWVVVAIVGVAGLTLGTAIAGAPGAAAGALVRDLFFCLSTWLMVRRSRPVQTSTVTKEH